jgi:isoleucyl-tRNA synthetase
MGRQNPYRNVISLGHVLDQKGEKMSKSRGNIVNPWDIINKYGIDPARWYFYTINSPGEPKLFNEKDVDGVVKRFLMIYLNCLVFFETYGVNKPAKIKIKPVSILDKWILSRLNSTVLEMTESLDRFEITEAARALEKFVIDDLSLWHIRRSRKRFQNPQDKKELTNASEVLHYVFSVIAKLGAPFIPFFSEEVWQRLGYKSSVHLTDWPKADKKGSDLRLEKTMAQARQIIGDALALRAKAGIKVRQPLKEVVVTQAEVASNKGICELIKDELNVKSVIMGKELALDLNITPELKEEGTIRDVMRFIQEARKEANLKPTDCIMVVFSGEGSLIDLLKKNQASLLKEARIEKISFSLDKPDYPIEKEIVSDSQKVLASIKKIK